MNNSIGISPEWLARVDHKVDAIMSATSCNPAYRWWTWQLVALIECGQAAHTRYTDDGGVTCDGWSSKSDPMVAYEGARRMEPRFWHGWALYSCWINTPEDREAQFEANRSTYETYDLYWEREETIAGYRCWRSFDTSLDMISNEVQARVFAAQMIRRPSTRCVQIGLTCMGSWRVWVDATRRVPECQDGHKGRVPAVKHSTIEPYARERA